MMKTFTSFALFVSTLKADVCLSGEGNSNIGFYGHYAELGEDSNGYMQYKEETICGDNYLYNNYNRWATSNSLGSSTTNIRCSTRSSSITSPTDCPNWSINSVSVTDTECREVILTCDTIEISGAYANSNGLYNKVENEDNLYKKEGSDYYFSYYANRRYFVGTADGDVRCSNSINYDLQIAQSSLSSLSDGAELTFNPTFPSNRKVTIKCSGSGGDGSTPKPTSSAPSTSGTVINTPAPVAVGSSDTGSDICVSSTSDSNYNAAFFGNYRSAGQDSNGNEYYVKDQAHCDDVDEYLYLTTSGYWQAHITLGSSSYYLRCPTQNIATPDLCAGNWVNGQIGADSAISASNIACPEDETPSLSCNYIEIDGASSFFDKTYTKIDDNLYEWNGYYLQYYKRGNYYMIQTSDIRETCDNVSYYLKTEDRDIDNLEHGDTVNAALVYPTGSANFKCLATSSSSS